MRFDGARLGLPRRQRTTTPPSLLVLAGERLGFGLRGEGFTADFDAFGATPEERYYGYVEMQLAPDQIVDTECNGKIAQAAFSTINKPHWQLWADHVNGNEDRYDPIREIELLTWIRACYSRRQLNEVLADFWHNHFNAFGWEYWSAPVWPSYDRAIRLNMFNNFRWMLEQIGKNSAMLYYLDQYTSTGGGPNENYARELFELHTLGSEHYYGVRPQSQVPRDQNGLPMGYVDEDVFEATFALTGWTVNNGYNGPADDGTFYFDFDSHDRGQKWVLREAADGNNPPIPSNGGEIDGHIVLDRLCKNPRTGLHIARKLCQRFLGDNPPQSLINTVGQVFTSNWQAGDQLRQTYRAILQSAEFKSTWGEKTKRPFELIAGLVRGTEYTIDFIEGADDLNEFRWRFDQTGQPLFSWPAPDGYPEKRTKWESTTPRVLTWRMANWLTDATVPNGPKRMNMHLRTPGGLRTPTLFVDYWLPRLLGQRPIQAADRSDLISFMANGANPNQGMNFLDEDTESRARSVIGVILNSPYFLEK